MEVMSNAMETALRSDILHSYMNPANPLLLRNDTSPSLSGLTKEEPRELHCPLCQTILGSQKDFTAHIRGHNEVKPVNDPNDPSGQSKVYFCCLCRKMLSSFSSLDRHMLVHSGERPFSCEKCGQTFTTNGNMHRHKRTHGNRDSHESDASSNASSTKGRSGGGRKRKSESTKEPLLPMSNSIPSCPICKMTLFSEIVLESHVNTFHPGVNIPCDECSISFPNFEYLKLHKSVSHRKSSFSIHALVASNSNNRSEEEDDDDMEVHSPLPPKENILDLSSAPSSSPLKSSSIDSAQDNSIDENDHLIRAMKLKGEFPCRLCTAIYPNLRALKGHNKEHLNKAPYYCNVGTCTYSSSDKSTLARHMRAHTGEKPFECKICHFGFTTKANCERHVKNKHSKSSRDEIRESIVLHDTDEVNSNEVQENIPDTVKPTNLKPEKSQLFFAPYASSLFRPADEIKSENEELTSPLDLSSASECKKAKVNVAPSSPNNSYPFYNPVHLSNKDESVFGASPPPMFFPHFGNLSLAASFFLAQQAAAAAATDPSNILRHLSALQQVQQRAAAEKVEAVDTDYKMVIKNGVLMKKQKQRRYRKERPYVCSICEAKFTLRSNMERHVKHQHPELSQIRQEQDSVKEFEDDDEEDINVIDDEEDDSNFKCSECPLWFGSSVSRDSHLLADHRNNNIQKDENEIPVYKCYLCDEGSFGEREDALNHLKMVHPSEWNDLSERGTFETALNETVETTEGEAYDALRNKLPDYVNRKVICLFCTRKFWSAEDLRRHVRSHTGERPYSCDICQRRFSLKHSMIRHRKKHDSGVSSDSESDGSREDGGEQQKRTNLMNTINKLSTCSTSS